MRVVVIGAGVIGLAAAHRLQRAGADVIVVERDAYGQGPSHGNAAFVTDSMPFPVPAPGTIAQGAAAMLGLDRFGPIHVQVPTSPARALFLARMALATRRDAFEIGTVAQEYLSLHTMESFDELAAEGLQFDTLGCGTLHVYETAEEFEAAWSLYERFPTVLARVRALTTHEEIAALDPLLSTRYTHGIYAPGDRVVEPELLMKALVGAITEAGGTILEHTPVLDFIRQGDAVTGVVTTAGVLDCDAVVIAAGVGSRALAGKLGFALPLYGGGGYSVDFSTAEDERPALGVLTGRTHLVASPLPGGRVRVSSGMVVGQSTPDVSDAIVDHLFTDLAETYPEVTPTDVAVKWAGLRPFSADGVPIIGRVPTTANAYLDTGHVMLGLTYAPISARVLTDLITGGPDRPVYQMYSPERFGTSPGSRWKARLAARRAPHPTSIGG